MEENTSERSLQLSVVIPAHNEAANLKRLLPDLSAVLQGSKLTYEIIVMDDHSTDGTSEMLQDLSMAVQGLKGFRRNGEKGFGRTLRDGFAQARGEVVVPFMGDASDDASDVLRLYHKIQEGYDVVYGSRFGRGGSVRNYPLLKRIANRLGNLLVRWLFHIPEKDITNAFKAFRREALLSLFPIQATEFNITLELALKAHLKEYRYTSIPVHWEGRTSGVSKFKLRDLTRYYRDYLFTLFGMLGHAMKKERGEKG